MPLSYEEINDRYHNKSRVAVAAGSAKQYSEKSKGWYMEVKTEEGKTMRILRRSYYNNSGDVYLTND